MIRIGRTLDDMYIFDQSLEVLTDSSPVGHTNAVIRTTASLTDVVVRIPANVSGLHKTN